MAEEGFSLDPISIGFLVKSFGQSEAADVEEFISASKVGVYSAQPFECLLLGITPSKFP